MPGGSALAAGGCYPDGAGACTPSPDVYWITRAGRVDLLGDELDVDATHAELVPGEEGRPWLFAVGSDGTRALRRFDPWLGRFVADDVPAPPADPTARLLAGDSGLLVWLGAEDASGATTLTGFRHGTRGEYAQAVAPLLLVDTVGVALDRALGAGTGTSGDAHRAASTGDVVLTASDATLVLTDTTYADLTLTVSVRAGAPPAVALGAATFGVASCPWPKASLDAPYDATLSRVGGTVRLAVAGKTRDCVGPEGRVSVSLRPTVGELDLRQITVSRSGP